MIHHPISGIGLRLKMRVGNSRPAEDGRDLALVKSFLKSFGDAAGLRVEDTSPDQVRCCPLSGMGERCIQPEDSIFNTEKKESHIPATEDVE